MKPDRINGEALEAEIIKVVKAYFKPNVIANTIRDIDRLGAFERTLVGEQSVAKLSPRRLDGSFSSHVNQNKIDALIALCHQALGSDANLHVMLRIGDLFRDFGDLPRAEQLYTMALVYGEQAEEKRMVGEAYLRRGDLYLRLGRWKASAADLDQSRRISHALNEPVAMGKVDNVLGTSYALQGKLKQAKDYYQKALASFEHSEETHLTGAVQMNLGIVYNIMGQLEVAMTHYQRARSNFEAVGDLARLAELHHKIGMTYLSKDALDDAIREFDLCVELCTEKQQVNVLGLAYLGRSNVYYRLGDYRIALRLLNQAMEYLTISNDRISFAEVYKLKGMIHREMRKYSFAEAYFQTSLRINLEMQNRLHAGETFYELGILEKKRGRPEVARQALENARACFRKVGATKEIQQTEEELHSFFKKGG